MLVLLEAFLQILLRRRGPEDLPDSRFLLTLALGAYVLAQVPLVILLFDGWSSAALLALLADVALLSACFWAPLRFTGRVGRYRQTLTALAGTGALLAMVQVPLVMASRAGDPGLPTVALLVMLAWTVVVQAHIASRALSAGFGVGLAIALAYFLITFQVTGLLAPPQAAG